MVLMLSVSFFVVYCANYMTLADYSNCSLYVLQHRTLNGVYLTLFSPLSAPPLSVSLALLIITRRYNPTYT